jgi:crotonobetainyl-CoA:carnitine CoA-transferase CaiB-like acyl-CoA transferase
VRVLELGQLVAGPWAAALLGWFGAEVIKIEPPGGDPLRTWRGVVDGTSLWWRGVARNKRLVTLDLRQPEGRALLRRLVPACDVLIENFRPGRLEAWDLGPDALRALRPDLILCRISGHGQTGPRRDLPGYASAAEAWGGLRALTGPPGGATVRSNLSLGDTLAGLQGAFGVTLALLHRARGGGGQDVDVSLVESVFSMLEAVVTEAAEGLIRERAGGAITGVVPSGAWPCADGELVLGANGEGVFRRLCAAMGRPALADDPRFQGNPARVAHQAALDAEIGAWAAGRTVAEALAALEAAGVPAAPVRGPRELLTDPQLWARGAMVEVSVGGRRLVLPEPGPKLSASPGRTRHAGGDPGADTDAVFTELLGLPADELRRLRAAGVLG